MELLSRAFAVAAVVGIAAIHSAAARDAYSSAHYIFWMYVALVASAVPLTVLLIHWRSPLVWVATAALAAGPLVGYLWSRAIGLPGDSTDVGDWLNPLGISSMFVEASLILLSLARLPFWGLRRGADRQPLGAGGRIRLLPGTAPGLQRPGPRAA